MRASYYNRALLSDPLLVSPNNPYLCSAPHFHCHRVCVCVFFCNCLFFMRELQVRLPPKIQAGHLSITVYCLEVQRGRPDNNYRLRCTHNIYTRQQSSHTILSYLSRNICDPFVYTHTKTYLLLLILLGFFSSTSHS